LQKVSRGSAPWSIWSWSSLCYERTRKYKGDIKRALLADSATESYGVELINVYVTHNPLGKDLKKNEKFSRKFTVLHHSGKR
jgi:hypothetical protein